MKLLCSLAVICLVLQVAVGQSCPSGVDIKLPVEGDYELLAEFYDNGRTTQVVPPQGTTIDVIFFSFRFEDLSSAQSITLNTSRFFNPIATFSVIRCEGFLFAPDVVIPNGLFHFVIEGLDSSGFEELFAIAGPHFDPATSQPPTTQPVTSTPEATEPETLEPEETSEPETESPEPVTPEPDLLSSFNLVVDSVRPENLTISRRQSARIVFTLNSTSTADRTRFTVRVTSPGLRLRARPRRFVVEPGSSRNIILRIRAPRRTQPGIHFIVVELVSQDDRVPVVYNDRITVRRNPGAPIPTNVVGNTPTPPFLGEPSPCDICLNGGSCTFLLDSISREPLELRCICTPEHTGSNCETRLPVT